MDLEQLQHLRRQQQQQLQALGVGVGATVGGGLGGKQQKLAGATSAVEQRYIAVPLKSAAATVTHPRRIMTDIVEENNYLVRVRAQVMTRDDSSGGWVPLGGGGLSNVSVRRRVRIATAPLVVPTTDSSLTIASSTTTVSSTATATTTVIAATATTTTAPSTPSPTEAVAPSDEPSSPAGAAAAMVPEATSETTVSPKALPAPAHEYLIYGKRISDQSVVLSCTIKKDFEYNKVMPTFHHWRTGDKRFGLTFQTAADARAFDRGVRTAVEELLDGLADTYPSGVATKEVGDDDVFMTLNLPQEKLSGRMLTEPTKASSEQHLARLQYITSEKPSELRPLAYDPMKSEKGDYSYVHLHAMHEYTYPMLDDPARAAAAGGSGKMSPAMISPHHHPLHATSSPSVITRPPGLKGSGMEMHHPLAAGGALITQPLKLSASSASGGLLLAGSPTGSLAAAASGKDSPEMQRSIASGGTVSGGLLSGLGSGIGGGSSPVDTYRRQTQCRHCQEMYLPGRDDTAGSCEYAPDACRACINFVSCLACAECVTYHCASDAEGEFVSRPCSCPCGVCSAGGRNQHVETDDLCVLRWACLAALSLFVPCLWLYPCLSTCHRCGVRCGVCGGRHAAPAPPDN